MLINVCVFVHIFCNDAPHSYRLRPAADYYAYIYMYIRRCFVCIKCGACSQRRVGKLASQCPRKASTDHCVRAHARLHAGCHPLTGALVGRLVPFEPCSGLPVQAPARMMGRCHGTWKFMLNCNHSGPGM